MNLFIIYIVFVVRVVAATCHNSSSSSLCEGGLVVLLSVLSEIMFVKM